MSEQVSTNTTDPTTEFHFDRSKLAVNFDVAKLQQDAYNIVKDYQPFYVHYNIVPLTTPGRNENDAESVPGEKKDFSNPKWTSWVETTFMQKCPYIKEVLNSLDCEKTNIRLMRLAPGSFLDEHTDPQLDLEFRKQVRLHVPIFTNPHVEFLLNKIPVPLQPGELWYLKLSDPHAVVNAGPTERIQLSIDVVVNEWVEDMILEGQFPPLAS